MKSNYDILGNHIRLIDTRNTDSVTDRVLGINIDKFFMPSVANVIGTDLSIQTDHQGQVCLQPYARRS